MTHIRVRDARGSEQQQALQIALSEPGLPAQQAQKVCHLMETFLQRCGGSIGGLHLVENHGRVATACAALDLPGGVSLLVLPTWMLSDGLEGWRDLLALAAQSARDRGRRFAQVMLEPELAESLTPTLREAGFAFLANLRYLQRNAYDPVAITPIEGANWRTLAETDEATFADVIRRTYIDSRDCPALTGVRSMADVLDSHRHAGEFDPRSWYLLEHAGEPAGVLITARTPLRANLEVIYVGLVPQARGKGLGRLCMHRAIQRARDLALAAVTLAVDAGNDPAGRLYTGMGFSQYAAKDVWIEVFRRADAEGLFTLPAQ